VDETFSAVPSPYRQLNTISFLVDHHVFPAVFGILKNKKEETNTYFFRILKQLNEDLNPGIIKPDFESAFINALRKSFERAEISGCQFHLGQNIIREIKDMKLYSEYLSNNNCKKHVKALMALSYVSKEKIIETFNDLKNSSDFPTKLTSLYNFFLQKLHLWFESNEIFNRSLKNFEI
jgi:hypothetical protein